MNEELTENLLSIVLECISKMLHVSQIMISIKAKSMFHRSNEDPAVRDSFVASKCRLDNFMKVNGLSCRRCTTAVQKDPHHIIEKLAC